MPHPRHSSARDVANTDASGSKTSKVFLVTGGTDGIGRAVALDLARRGHRVLFIGRHADRGAGVLAALQNAGPAVEHAFLRADLALLSDTARVAAAVARTTPTLDGIICCAGILSIVPEFTAERLERNFVLNYLSRYLLVRALLPLLRSAPSGRIVLVSNAGKYDDTLDFDDLQHRRGKRGMAVAGRTQFANDLLTIELAERLRDTPIQVTCVFPGVTRTACFQNSRGLPWLVRALAPLAVRLFGISAEAAAETPVYLASDPEATETSGRFYGPRKAQLEVPARARNPERRAALWTASADLVRAYLDEAVAPASPPVEVVQPSTGNGSSRAAADAR